MVAYNNVKAGSVTEMVFERFLSQHKATFKMVTPEVSSKVIMNLALRYCKVKVDSYLRNSGRQLFSLYALEASELLDTFFNCDYLVEVEVDDLKLVVSMDLTVDESKVVQKERSMYGSSKQFPELGIDLGIVIHVGEDTNFIEPKSSYKIAGQILMAIEDLWFAEKSVGTVVI